MHLKLFSIALASILFLKPNPISARGEITHFEHKIHKDKYGTTKLTIYPVAFDATKTGDNKWGVLICYKLSAVNQPIKQKTLRQDMSYQLDEKDKYEVAIAYSEHSVISDLRLEYFKLTTKESTWPKKNECFH